jgi:four helix bundle protein
MGTHFRFEQRLDDALHERAKEIGVIGQDGLCCSRSAGTLFVGHRLLLRFGLSPLPIMEGDGRMSKQHRYVQELVDTTFRVGLADQMKRAATSVMANIAERIKRNRPGEFHQFLSMAMGSCGELRSHVYVTNDAGHLGAQMFNRLMESTIEVGQIIGGLCASVERQRNLN